MSCICFCQPVYRRDVYLNGKPASANGAKQQVIAERKKDICLKSVGPSDPAQMPLRDTKVRCQLVKRDERQIVRMFVHQFCVTVFSTFPKQGKHALLQF